MERKSTTLIQILIGLISSSSKKNKPVSFVRKLNLSISKFQVQENPFAVLLNFGASCMHEQSFHLHGPQWVSAHIEWTNKGFRDRCFHIKAITSANAGTHSSDSSRAREITRYLAMHHPTFPTYWPLLHPVIATLGPGHLIFFSSA